MARWSTRCLSPPSGGRCWRTAARWSRSRSCAGHDCGSGFLSRHRDRSRMRRGKKFWIMQWRHDGQAAQALAEVERCCVAVGEGQLNDRKIWDRDIDNTLTEFYSTFPGFWLAIAFSQHDLSSLRRVAAQRLTASNLAAGRCPSMTSRSDSLIWALIPAKSTWKCAGG